MTMSNYIKASRAKNSHVISKGGRVAGRRHVMYCPGTKLYVSGSCTSTTNDRMWAWSGTEAQSEMARQVFGIGDEYLLYLDGEEKSGG